MEKKNILARGTYASHINIAPEINSIVKCQLEMCEGISMVFLPQCKRSLEYGVLVVPAAFVLQSWIESMC